MMQIRGIGLASPGQPIDQTELLDVALRYNADTEADRAKLTRIYRRSKVLKRHSVLACPADTGRAPIDELLNFYTPAHPQGPTTHARMQRYETHATGLSVEACHAALRDSATPPEAIAQLITVSCTGLVAPGQDAGLIQSLGLRPDVGRTHIGFMGCHAAINAMRVADGLIHADPGERVLVCCTELCSLHFQYGTDPQDAVANALFADGSAALVAGRRDASEPGPCARSFHAEHLPGTRDMMSWRITDHGFRMRLDPQVPDTIQRSLAPSLSAWLSKHDLDPRDIEAWAVHPGGPRIIDAVQAAMGLKPEALQVSRDILRDFGNMSSPTVLFIMSAMMRDRLPKPWIALGFGPGLAIEASLMT
ncbi:MAG: type III polyketide synthase [Phycisphaeraceae bacterium]